MKLRVSLNAKKITGPYGGGNQFANGLETYLTEQNHTVYRKLVPTLDLILIVSSKRHYQTTSYDIDAIRDYKKLYPNTVIVHRVNSCDEPRGRDLGINAAMLAVNQLADYTIFISSFVRDLFDGHGMDMNKPHSVILNGGDANIFYPAEPSPRSPGQKIKIVTHHWSTNYMKGFDIYERLGLLLGVESFKSLFDFTYIGNVPLGVQFENCRVIPPVSGMALGDLLRQHDVYVTAARNESAGMHHIEAVRCGLPILYLNSGALPEYCHEYGVEFTLCNFEQKLLEMKAQINNLRDKVLSCPYSADWMANQYEGILLGLVERRRENPLPPPSIVNRLRIKLIDRTLRKFTKALAMSKRIRDYLS